MEAVAKMFEQEKGISDEVENQVKQIHQIQEDDYVPFSEVSKNPFFLFFSFLGYITNN